MKPRFDEMICDHRGCLTDRSILGTPDRAAVAENMPNIDPHRQTLCRTNRLVHILLEVTKKAARRPGPSASWAGALAECKRDHRRTRQREPGYVRFRGTTVAVGGLDRQSIGSAPVNPLRNDASLLLRIEER